MIEYLNRRVNTLVSKRPAISKSNMSIENEQNTTQTLNYDEKCPIKVNKIDFTTSMTLRKRKKRNKKNANELLSKDRDKPTVNLVKKYRSAFNITPIGKSIFQEIQKKQEIEIFMRRQFIKYYKYKSIKDNNDEFDINKIKSIQYWWKTIYKIILLQKNILHYLYKKRIQKKKKIMNLGIFNLHTCIIKIFFRYLMRNIKEINDKENQYIKSNYFNKWLGINRKILVIEKLINKQKKIANKNFIIQKCKTNIIRGDNTKKFNKIKALKSNGIFYKNQSLKTNPIFNNQNSNTINSTIPNNSINKKLNLIKSQNKNGNIELCLFLSVKVLLFLF